jgi:magnesium transporter
METNFRFKNLNLIEITNPTKEDIINLSKKFKIKEINIRHSLASTHYTELIIEKNYINFQLICPLFINNYLYFEKFGIFLLNRNVVLINKENIKINKIKLKTLSALKKITYSKNIDFNKLFVSLFVSFLVKSYFPLLQTFSEQLSEIENKLETSAPLKTISQISKLRRNLVFAHTGAKSTLEVINQVIKNELFIIKSNLDIWNTIQDNMNFITEKLDDYEKILEGLSRSFESRLSFQINKSIEILTIIQSIFLPAMIISSIYGMNIDLPFQKSKIAFFIISLVMAISTLVLVLIIKKIKQ